MHLTVLLSKLLLFCLSLLSSCNYKACTTVYSKKNKIILLKQGIHTKNDHKPRDLERQVRRSQSSQLAKKAVTERSHAIPKSHWITQKGFL